MWIPKSETIPEEFRGKATKVLARHEIRFGPDGFSWQSHEIPRAGSDGSPVRPPYLRPYSLVVPGITPVIEFRDPRCARHFPVPAEFRGTATKCARRGPPIFGTDIGPTPPSID